MNAWNSKNDDLIADDLANDEEGVEGSALSFAITPDPVDEEPIFIEPKTRIGRAALVEAGKVINVLVVVVNDNDEIQGFEPPYGQELFVVDDESPVGVDWDYADGEFTEPEEDITSLEV